MYIATLHVPSDVWLPPGSLDIGQPYPGLLVYAENGIACRLDTDDVNPDLEWISARSDCLQRLLAPFAGQRIALYVTADFYLAAGEFHAGVIWPNFVGLGRTKFAKRGSRLLPRSHVYVGSDARKRAAANVSAANRAPGLHADAVCGSYWTYVRIGNSTEIRYFLYTEVL